MELRIENEADLRTLLGGRPALGRLRSFTLAVDELSADEQMSIQARLNRYASACGCGAAAGASLVVTGFYMALAPWSANASAMDWSKTLLVAVTLFFLSGAAGKMAGMGYSRWQLRRTLQDLQSRLSSRALREPDGAHSAGAR